MIKSRLSESSRQEQLMLLRLGEIWLETRNRERWEFVERRVREQQQQQQQGHGGGSISSEGVPATPHMALPATAESFTCASVLSPLSPAFVPGRGVNDEDIWGRISMGVGEKGRGEEEKKGGEPSQEGKGEAESGLGEQSKGDEEISDDVVEKGGDEKNNEGEENDEDNDKLEGPNVVFNDVVWEYEDKDGESSGKKHSLLGGRRSMPLNTTFTPQARDKRMSLPALRTIWPRSNSMIETVEDDEKLFRGPLDD